MIFRLNCLPIKSGKTNTDRKRQAGKKGFEIAQTGQ